MQPQPQPPPQSGVSSCYVFKSRLQEYAQKVSLPTPVYETIKEGPSHEPTFRSTVILNDVRYDSLLGFFNRKAAEQSAAEVALLELSKNGEVSDGISQPVHETGLCKNLLQEYAQKMNYAIPLYECEKVESRGRATSFSCKVDIGGIRYIGAAARTKKEAEIKAARTALLAIQTSDASSNGAVKTDLTVLPCKKRGPETPWIEEASIPPKPKKARFKKKMSKKKQMKFKTDLNDDKLEVSEVSNVSETGAGDPQTEAVPENSFIDEVKEIAVQDLPTGNGNYNGCSSQVLMPPPLNLGNHISEVNGKVAVIDEVAPMCLMEQKIVVESMQAASDNTA